MKTDPINRAVIDSAKHFVSQLSIEAMGVGLPTMSARSRLLFAQLAKNIERAKGVCNDWTECNTATDLADVKFDVPAVFYDAFRNLLMAYEAHYIDWSAMNPNSADYDPTYKPRFPQLALDCAELLKTLVVRSSVELDGR